MQTCERCGSAEVRRVRSNRFQRLFRMLTGRKRFTCMACGWTALRAWDENAAASSHTARRFVDVKAQARTAERDPRR